MKREIIDASKLELEDKVVDIKRVTKVVKGGRNSRFACLVVVGDKNGHVGVGVGKAVEIPEAIRKGKEDAAKHLVTVPVNENGSIPYDWNGEFAFLMSSTFAVSIKNFIFLYLALFSFYLQACHSCFAFICIHAISCFVFSFICCISLPTMLPLLLLSLELTERLHFWLLL